MPTAASHSILTVLTVPMSILDGIIIIHVESTRFRTVFLHGWYLVMMVMMVSYSTSLFDLGRYTTPS